VAFFPKYTAAKNVFSLFAKILSLYEIPGVTSSITPRLTIFLVVLGSSSCSHTATRSPARTSFGR